MSTNAALDTCYAHSSVWLSVVDALIYMLVLGVGFVLIFGSIMFGIGWVASRMDEYEAIRRIKHNEKVKAVIVKLVEKIEGEREQTHDPV